jgi:hypothetical protein
MRQETTMAERPHFRQPWHNRCPKGWEDVVARYEQMLAADEPIAGLTGPKRLALLRFLYVWIQRSRKDGASSFSEMGILRGQYETARSWQPSGISTAELVQSLILLPIIRCEHRKGLRYLNLDFDDLPKREGE